MYTLSINPPNNYQVHLLLYKECREAYNCKVGRQLGGLVGCASVVQGWYPAASQQIHLYISLARLLLTPTQYSFPFSTMSWQTLLSNFLWLICVEIFPVLIEKPKRIIQMTKDSLGKNCHSDYISGKCFRISPFFRTFANNHYITL